MQSVITHVTASVKSREAEQTAAQRKDEKLPEVAGREDGAGRKTGSDWEPS